jgi:hypothetical protein
MPQKFVGVEKLNASQPSTMSQASEPEEKVLTDFINAVVFPVPATDVASPEDSVSQNELVTVPTRAPVKPPTDSLVAVAESVINPME